MVLVDACPVSDGRSLGLCCVLTCVSALARRCNKIANPVDADKA